MIVQIDGKLHSRKGVLLAEPAKRGTSGACRVPSASNQSSQSYSTPSPEVQQEEIRCANERYRTPNAEIRIGYLLFLLSPRVFVSRWIRSLRYEPGYMLGFYCAAASCAGHSRVIRLNG